MDTRRPVIVMELPQQLKRAEAKAFLAELQPILENDRPCIVLDCSQVRNMDSAGVGVILEVLQQVRGQI
jgi:anti-anti-sigma factor